MCSAFAGFRKSEINLQAITSAVPRIVIHTNKRVRVRWIPFYPTLAKVQLKTEKKYRNNKNHRGSVNVHWYVYHQQNAEQDHWCNHKRLKFDQNHEPGNEGKRVAHWRFFWLKTAKNVKTNAHQNRQHHSFSTLAEYRGHTSFHSCRNFIETSQTDTITIVAKQVIRIDAIRN